MVGGFDAFLKEGMQEARNMTSTDLIAFGKQETAFTTSLIETAIPVEISANLPAASMMRSIVHSRPFNGDTLTGWFKNLSRSTSAKVDRELRIGMMQGETTGQIVQRIRGKGRGTGVGGVINQTRRGTEAVVRSATNHVGTQARQSTYAENDDLVKGWKFLATLDARTTLICASNDGKVFPIGEGPMPPLHMGCRSADSPILASWQDIGLDIPEDDEGTRASMDGEVPETVTYSEWLKGQDLKTQQQVLGKRRAAMFRAGDINIDRFTDDFGNTVNLDQLSDLEQSLLN
jgi:SPP1 gp7 family putative phage head morphogenesis protein